MYVLNLESFCEGFMCKVGAFYDADLEIIYIVSPLDVFCPILHGRLTEECGKGRLEMKIKRVFVFHV